jgi:hypothetical protein
MATPLDGKSPFKEEAEALVAQSGLGNSTKEILGPFSDIANQIAEAFWLAILPSATANSLYWPLLLLTAAMPAAFLYLRDGRGAKGADGHEQSMGLWEYPLPRSIYRHPPEGAE